MIPYYMIVNAGTLLHSTYAQAYPRHLVLHDVYRQDELYRSKLQEMQCRHRTRIILDNGAHEGIYPSLPDYLATTISLNPDVVVLTDVVGAASQSSRSRAMEFAKMITDRFPKMQMMYAPQGETQDEIIREYEWAINSLDPEKYIIGFGQGYLRFESPTVKDEAARLVMINRVMHLTGALRMTYHVLGARWNPTSAFNSWSRIVGLDTVKPCTCALGNTTYPIKPTEGVNRYSHIVANDVKLSTNVCKLADAYGLQTW